MAGGGDQSENPVAINVVPMVDVIFCLCIFFMCSFKFKQLEGKFDSWLPRNKGMEGTPAEIQEIRVAMFWDAETQKVRRQYGSRIVEDDAQLESLIRGAYDDFKLKGRPEAPVIVDGDPRIPWHEVIKVINMCKKIPIDNIEFALGKAD